MGTSVHGRSRSSGYDKAADNVDLENARNQPDLKKMDAPGLGDDQFLNVDDDILGEDGELIGSDKEGDLLMEEDDSLVDEAIVKQGESEQSKRRGGYGFAKIQIVDREGGNPETTG